MRSGSANEQAQRMNKKTIQPKDVLDAIDDIEFDAFLPRLEAELAKYNAVQCDKRNSYRRKVREEQKAKVDPAQEGEESAPLVAVTGEAGVPVVSPKRDGDLEPRAKKVRGEDGMEIDEEEDAPDEPDVEEEDVPDEDDDDDDDDGEETFEDAKEELAEDPLEEESQARNRDMEDEALDDGHDSD